MASADELEERTFVEKYFSNDAKIANIDKVKDNNLFIELIEKRRETLASVEEAKQRLKR